MHATALAALIAVLCQNPNRITVEIFDPSGRPYDAKAVSIAADPPVRDFPMRKEQTGVWSSTDIPAGVLAVTIYISRPDGPQGDRGTFPVRRDRQRTIRIDLEKDDLDPDRRPAGCGSYLRPIYSVDSCGRCCVMGYERVECPCPQQSTEPPRRHGAAESTERRSASFPAKVQRRPEVAQLMRRSIVHSAWVPERIDGAVGVASGPPNYDAISLSFRYDRTTQPAAAKPNLVAGQATSEP